MVDLLDEVIEEATQEKWYATITKYGKIAIFILFLFISVSCIAIWWQDHSKNKIYNEGANFLILTSSINQHNNKETIEKLEKLIDGDSVYATFAAFKLAEILEIKEDYNRAINIYSSIAKNNNIEQSLRDYALLMKINANLQAKTLTDNEILQQINQYISTNPVFKVTAQVILSSLLIDSNQNKEAENTLNMLVTNMTAPESIKRIAELLLSLSI